ncbi:Clp protease N-terminal domain-containing protein [Streptomyces sp. ISL-11]|uniref:Clp protease N-terminal domain-containing protein n=1 Tax=Streptomyces sp. ISL-11 TaxID=2819174 RepID=UPI001BE8DF51|nr:Clp protease N-terminal domain-containing protein [Streptomyces sp. ISL-11]MBT2383432.1 hypothetical protein [Streptomyces sp. ISL-11]
MFERFTLSARMAVVRTQQEARDLGHPWIGSEHLLLALVGEKDAPLPAFARLGLTHELCRAAVRSTVGGGSGVDEDDRDPLLAFGIDLDAVRERAESAFGPGALDRPAPPPLDGDEPEPRRRLLSFGRRKKPAERPALKTDSSHLPWAPRGKKALENTLKVTLEQQDNRISFAHLALALLTSEDKVIVQVLRRLELTPETVHAAILADLGQAA